MKLAPFLFLSVLVHAACVAVSPGDAQALPDVEAAPGTPWIADPRDNVCGLSDPHHVTRPARLDYPRALEATPSMREMRAKNIDPKTAQGQILYARAETELCHAAREVREEQSHCSVWKRIRHRDGRKVPDRTEEIEAVLSGADAAAGG